MSRTVQQVDADLTEARERYITADLDGDPIAAGAAYLELDSLLDERAHIPQQRTG